MKTKKPAPRAAAPSPAPSPKAAADAAAAPDRATAWLAAGAAVLGVAWTAALAFLAQRGTFATDECFHAYASEWIAAHHRLPAVMPEFYSGFYYYYHPLLHVLGALSVTLFGAASLHVLPVAFAALALAALLAVPGTGVPAGARAWAALLCIASALYASFAVRLYVESLTALVFALAAVLLLRLRRAPTTAGALALGAVTGLSLLSKFSGWLLWGFLLALAAVYAARRERRLARLLALAAAIGLAISLPWLVRNHVLFGSAFYPMGAPDLDRTLYVLNRAKFSSPPARFLADAPGALGAGLAGMALAALAVAAFRRRWGLREGLVAFALAGMALVAVTPMAASRHLIPFLPVLALAASAAPFEALEARRRARWVVSALLGVAALAAVGRMPDWRRAADPPAPLHAALTQIGAHLPEDATVLSLWTYDTFYYARRRATWPNPWGQRVHPAAMFTERDTARFVRELSEYGIDYLFVPLQVLKAPWNSANYSEDFVTCATALMRSGTLRVEWASDQYALLAAPVAASAAPGSPPAR